MPSPREKLEFYWPRTYDLTEGGNYLVKCPLCSALVDSYEIQIHKEYHLKLLDRLDKIENALDLKVNI